MPIIAAHMADTKGSTQVITVTNKGSGDWAVLRAYEKVHGTWRTHVNDTYVRIGYNGFSTSTHEGSGTTPVGFFTVPWAFGNNANPGTALPWHADRYGDVFVDDTSSRYYNLLTTDNADFHLGSGERLWQVGVYSYAAFISYNRYPIVKGRGSAFFLHVWDGGSTAGCVSMPRGVMVNLLRWMKPWSHPRIAMGPYRDVLKM